MEVVQAYEFMHLEKEGQLAWLTFTRERYLNAMNNACTVQLLKITHALERDQ